MKPKELANVLIKILGLSLCAESVAPIINEILAVYANRGNGNVLWWSAFAYGLPKAIIGIIFIVKSRAIVRVLFRDEDE